MPRDRVLTGLLDWAYNQQLELGLGSLKKATAGSSAQLLIVAGQVQAYEAIIEEVNRVMSAGDVDPDQGKD